MVSSPIAKSVFRTLIFDALVFSRGLAISEDAGKHLKQDLVPYWIECGKKMQHLSAFCKNDPRVDNLVLPLYDGMSLIRWKQ